MYYNLRDGEHQQQSIEKEILVDNSEPSGENVSINFHTFMRRIVISAAARAAGKGC
jgi:hypothetical protein